MRLLVYGLGRSGSAVVSRAHALGDDVAFFEQRAAGTDVDEALAAGATRVDRVDTWPSDLCVAAPGVPIDHPDLQRLRARGVEVIGEVEWIARALPARLVGVTGTAGKGSVTRWLTDTLQSAGVDALAGGNLDPALAAVARADATWVVELSSFQLERCPTLRPDVAVVLNLGVDHLDRHGTVEAYHAAKRAILANLGPEQVFVFDGADATLRRWARQTPAALRPFVTGPAAAAALEDELGIAPAASVHLGDDTLRLGGRPLLRSGELALRGTHQHANALAVALAAEALGIDDADIAAGLRAFTGLPGRYSEVVRIGDVRYVDDSIATRELAVSAALEATPAPVVWIVGGVDKGADVSGLERLVRERVVLTLGIGRSGRTLCERVAAWVPSEYIDVRDGPQALRVACERALTHLQRDHGGVGTVLLAPLAASFDQFSDYRARGDAFAAAARTLADRVSGTLADGAREGGPWTRSC